ncbi:MAG: ketoacyl-ACP synthase III [Gemmataceae bacterium]|nr:ketoacyl-ACP synthase III [Gemmataceae bacterium]
MTNAAITGWGYYCPPCVLTNREIAEHVDTGDGWIRSRTGISERRIAGPEETTSTMATTAARRALDQARLSPNDIDLIICATTTPDYLLPATACLIQHQLGAEHAGAFDLNSACSGFLSALIVGNQFIQAGTCRRILVVAGETLSRFINWKDRQTCILFGDGAGAVVLEATRQSAGILSTVMGCQPDAERLLTIDAGGCARPASAETVAESAHCVRMRGNDVFRQAVRHMTQASQDAMAKANLLPDDIRTVVCHQANLRIIRAVQDRLGMPSEKTFVNVQRTGNTGATSVAIALGQMLGEQPARVGDHYLMVAFGGGFTWAAVTLRWADLALIVGDRGLQKSA